MRDLTLYKVQKEKKKLFEVNLRDMRKRLLEREDDLNFGGDCLVHTKTNGYSSIKYSIFITHMSHTHNTDNKNSRTVCASPR